MAMRFDLFHSIGRIDSISPRLSDREVFEGFFAQAKLAEDLGFKTIWAAESHFSSEVQKANTEAVIPNYLGEVGLNCDSPLLAQHLFSQTKRIGFGTAIFNIVGGNGGPIGAADRIRSLTFLNSLQANPRQLDIGVAAGRFPYINRPYGVFPRTSLEKENWPEYKRLIFIEALEIFLRLSQGEILNSDMLTSHKINEKIPYEKRWQFERLKLVPDLDVEAKKHLRFVLGSADPLAREVGSRFADMDIFNLSFTPPDKINAVHSEMQRIYSALNRKWHRGRMPRTVLVFIDKSSKQALQNASDAFDTYIEAMRGTVGTPPKDVLMERALIGDASMIREQLSPDDPHGFQTDDRLMLWFEFNQANHEKIMEQMRYFAQEVMPHYG